MIIEKKYNNVYHFSSYQKGILYVDKNDSNAIKLVYEKNGNRIFFNQFNVENYWINDKLLTCFAMEMTNEGYRTVLLDEDFNILKRFYKTEVVVNCKNEYYYKSNKDESGIASLNTDELLLSSEKNLTGRGIYKFNDKYFIQSITDSGIVFIKKLADKTCIKVDVFAKLNIPINEDRHFQFAHIYDNRVLLFADFYFLIIDCETGEIIFTIDTEIGFHQFEMIYPFIYCNAGSHIAKYKIEENNTIVNIYNHRLEKAENEYVGNDYISLSFIREIYISGNKIYGINTSTPSFLLIQDAETGKRIKAIDLRPFGINEAWQVVVAQNKFYITDYNCNAWVFENEDGE
jgi:hypothetical protein